MTKFSAALAIPAALAFALPELRTQRQTYGRALALAILALLLILVAAPMLIDPLPLALQEFLARFRLESTHLGPALRSYVLSPGAGIWGTSPIVLLALAGGVALWRQGRSRLVLAICLLSASYVFGHALSTGAHWFGGLSWPPRFLLPMLPVLMLATAPMAERLLRPGHGRLRVLWCALLLYGAWIQFNSVALSWSHFGESLPAEAQKLSEWPPAMWQPAYFRWAVLPTRWPDLGLDFLWTRANLPLWGVTFSVLICVAGAALWFQLRSRPGKWRYAPLILAPLSIAAIYLNLHQAYDRDPRTNSQQAALHEALDYLEAAARPNDVLLLPGNDYGNFILNHHLAADPRVIVLPRPLAQAASDRQPAQVVSNNANSWFDVHSARAIQHAAGHHDRIWLLANTSPYMSWSFRPLERYLVLHIYLIQEVQLSQPYDTVRLLEYSTEAPVFNPMSLYAGEIAADLRFGSDIEMLGIAAPAGSAYRAGEAVAFSLLWGSSRHLDRNYTVATFIASAATGQPIAQGWDSPPQAGFAPTTEWTPGAPVWDNRAIRLPLDAPPGDYRIWVLLYYRDGGSGEIKRLPVSGAEVTGDNDIGVLPLTFQVQRAQA